MSKESFAIIGIRLIAVLFMSSGLVLLLGNVLETAWDFNPNYLGYYFATQLLRPSILCALGGLLLFLSRGLGKLLSRNQ